MSNHYLPPIAGHEAEILALVQQHQPVFLRIAQIDLASINSVFACALHMHQPTIPVGVDGELIGHLQFMFEHSGEGDNHNAVAFANCYMRMADLLTQLIADGCQPRIMLDYSGNLLWGATI